MAKLVGRDVWVSSPGDVWPGRVTEEPRNRPSHVVVVSEKHEHQIVPRSWLIFSHNDLVAELQMRVLALFFGR